MLLCVNYSLDPVKAQLIDLKGTATVDGMMQDLLLCLQLLPFALLVALAHGLQVRHALIQQHLEMTWRVLMCLQVFDS